jgi:hypothetical protein
MKFEMEQKKKEAAELDAPIEGSILFDQFTQGFTEEQKKQGKDMLVKHGVLTPDGLTSKRKMADAQKMILMSKQASEWVQTAKRDASLRWGQDIMSKLQKSKESQDQGKIDEYTKAYDDWSKGHNSMLGNFEQMEDMRTGMELYKQVKEMGIEIPPEAMVVIATAANTGKNVKEAVSILKELATKGKQGDTSWTEAEVLAGKHGEEARKKLEASKTAEKSTMTPYQEQRLKIMEKTGGEKSTGKLTELQKISDVDNLVNQKYSALVPPGTPLAQVYQYLNPMQQKRYNERREKARKYALDGMNSFDAFKKANKEVDGGQGKPAAASVTEPGKSAPNPTSPPPGNKEGRYDIDGTVWNWTKSKGWYQ